MNNFIHSFRAIFLSGILVIFSISSLTRVHAFEPIETACGREFDVKIYELVMTLMKCEKSLNVNKAFEIMFKIKHTIEDYVHKKFNIDKAFKLLEQKIKEDEVKINKKDLENIRNYIKKVEIRFNHKFKYMSDCSLYNIPYDSELEHFNFMTTYGYSDEDSDSDELPVKVQVGIIIALAGAFMCYLPCCAGFGAWVIAGGFAMVTSGLSLAVDGGCDHIQEKKNKMKEKRREERSQKNKGN